MQTFTILGEDAPHRNLQSIHTKYESLHTFKDAIRGFRYCDLTSRSQLFSFIVNRKSLLFDMSLANISQTQPLPVDDVQLCNRVSSLADPDRCA